MKTPMKRVEGYFRGKNDLELFFQAWKHSNPSATLVVTHGLGEHSECYTRLVEGLSELPLDIVIWDMRGHGRSEGKRGVCYDFSDFSSDLVCLLETVKKEFPSESLFLLSHSMGGLVTLNMLTENPQVQPTAAVFSSPLLGVQVEIPKLKKTAARYLAQYLPELTLWNEIKHNVLTHDKSIIEEFEKDPLRHDRISSKLYLEMLDYTEKIQKIGNKIKFPILMQLAGQDKVVSTRASVDFFDTVASENKKKKVYENSYHEIYNDIEREIAFSDIRDWLKTFI